MRYLASLAAIATTLPFLATPAPATAQQTTDTTFSVGPNASVHIVTTTGDAAHPVIFHVLADSTLANRASLGMVLRITGSKRDTLGLFVESVVPNGPAEKAGIIEGDRIAAINDTDLRVAASDLGDSYIENVSLHRLSRQVTKLTPGAKTQLRVYADGHYKTITVTAEKRSTVLKNHPLQMHWGQTQTLDNSGPELAFIPQILENLQSAEATPNAAQLKKMQDMLNHLKTQLGTIQLDAPEVFELQDQPPASHLAF